MKLLRYGPKGYERPGMLDENGHIRDLSKHVRGLYGASLLPDQLDTQASFDGVQKAGSLLGSAGIIVVDDTACMVWLAENLLHFYRHESCGKCTPCREGTNWTVKMLERIQRGEATPMDLDIMASVQNRIIGNCLCVLGDSMALPLGSMIAKFREEFEAHMESARDAADRAAIEAAA